MRYESNIEILREALRHINNTSEKIDARQQPTPNQRVYDIKDIQKIAPLPISLWDDIYLLTYYRWRDGCALQKRQIAVSLNTDYSYKLLEIVYRFKEEYDATSYEIEKIEVGT